MPHHGIHHSIHKPHEGRHKGNVQLCSQLGQGVDIEAVCLRYAESRKVGFGQELLESVGQGGRGFVAGPEGDEYYFTVVPLLMMAVWSQ
jgi:hypothetical protein